MCHSTHCHKTVTNAPYGKPVSLACACRGQPSVQIPDWLHLSVKIALCGHAGRSAHMFRETHPIFAEVSHDR